MPFQDATSNQVVTIKMRLKGGAKTSQKDYRKSDANEWKRIKPECRPNDGKDGQPEDNILIEYETFF